MANIKYLKIEVEVVQKLGCNEAIFYAYLQHVARVSVKDRAGYFSLDSGYARRLLNVDRFRLRRLRDNLVRSGLVAHRPGTNQNSKPKYNML